jgi:predicted dehydrogenase
LKILIAGLGSIGRRHLRNLLALGEGDLLLYRTHHSTLPEEELAGIPVETDLAAALAHKPDAVIVSNPTALHLEVAIPAAQAGCHLFLEKPISHSLERIDQLQTAVQKGGCRVLVGFQFRFHPGLRQVKAWLEAGEIGRPLSVRAHWGEYLPAWHPWEDFRQGYSARSDLGGGVVLTLCHPLDYLRWLFGEVSELWAFTGTLNDLELNVEDTAEIGLRFASKPGALGSVHLDYNQRPPAHRLEIVGSQGTIQWNNASGAARLITADSQTRRFDPPEGFERNHLFLAQMQHFLEVVHGQAEPLCTLQDGIQALELALAVHHSQRERKLTTF